ncbi:MAG: hypothetical protein WD403_13165 [Pirellulales bacterium]
MGYTCRVKLAQAFHEAGHACMALILGRPADPVSLMFNRTGPGDGWRRRSPDVCKPGQVQFEADIMIGLAGLLAEIRSLDIQPSPRPPAQAGQAEFRQPPQVAGAIAAEVDRARLFGEARALMSRLPGRSHRRMAYLDRLLARTEAALTQPGCWEGVSAVAWALVYRMHLPAAELERIFWHTVSVNQVGDGLHAHLDPMSELRT